MQTVQAAQTTLPSARERDALARLYIRENLRDLICAQTPERLLELAEEDGLSLEVITAAGRGETTFLLIADRLARLLGSSAEELSKLRH